MKFIVEFRYDAAHRDAFRAAFESRGLGHAEGVSIQSGWISTKECLLFLVAESTDASQVDQACQAWSKFGQWKIHQVLDLDQL